MGASIKETIKATGQLSVVVTGPDGQVKNKQLFKNKVVTIGKEFIASRMISGSADEVMSHMAIGTGTTTVGEEADGDTTLASEVARVALTSSVIKEGFANVVQYTATFGPNVPGVTDQDPPTEVNEAAIFNKDTAGAAEETMLCRTTFAVVNKGKDDTLTITWEVTIN
jgi:hypothetical protein